MLQPGLKIKRLRKARNLTQQQLANFVEIDSTMITKIERGRSSGSLQTLNNIASALGVSITELLSDQPVPGRMAHGRTGRRRS